MRQGIVKASHPPARAPRAGEWIWGGVGVTAASLSACFAAYMMAFGPAETAGRNLGDFGLFARMQPIQRGIDGRVVPVLPGMARAVRTADGRSATTPGSGAVDFDPTGSLAGKTGGEGRPAGADTRVLASFILRDVFDGHALVETPNAITLVSKGSLIPGVGSVLSIERRGNQWTVVTSAGVIGGPR